MLNEASQLLAISPVDGRYRPKVDSLYAYFSEFGLIRYRLFIELHYFQALCTLPLPQLEDFPEEKYDELIRRLNRFDLEDAARVKAIENVTNHDVKAVEYLLKEWFDELGIGRYKEFIHFGLTSQDVNNTAIPLSLRHAFEQQYLPVLEQLVDHLRSLKNEWEGIPMLAHTHGQPATPTTVGKEIEVYIARLNNQTHHLKQLRIPAKFGGATGNFNAHHAAYPQIDWHAFAKVFVEDELGLERSYPTTQIEHYDNLAAFFMAMKRINTILIDLSRDMWTYISMDYFKQKVKAGEVGSSAMPHKVNPIDFENAEGNLGLANALLTHLADKLPVSRLQRDLTDSTVLRNIGVPFAHSLIAFSALLKGLGKLTLNRAALEQDLDNNWAVVAEAIQNILRREAYPEPYEALKELTRGKGPLDQEAIAHFIDGLQVSEAVKAELKQITPHNYLGRL
jgi:adenylosuccinate lyase